ncbi:MAG: HEAT repeat domain-containing protein [Planctomycetota bacterium]
MIASSVVAVEVAPKNASRELEKQMLALPPAAARAEIARRLAACTDALERGELVRIDRLVRLQRSPRELALATPPDLAGIRGAKGSAAIPEQVALLRDPSMTRDVRLAASEALGRAGDPRGLSVLLDAARTSDVDGRLAAVSGLAFKSPDESARQCLADLLGEGSADVRIAAARSIGGFGSAARARIREVLASEATATVVGALLQALGRAGTAEDLPLLIERCKATDPHYEVALRAARSLAARESLTLPVELRAERQDRRTVASKRPTK